MHGMTHDNLSVIGSLAQAVRGTFSDQYLFAYTSSELTAIVDAFETPCSVSPRPIPISRADVSRAKRSAPSCTRAARRRVIMSRRLRSPTHRRLTSPCATPRSHRATTTCTSIRTAVAVSAFHRASRPGAISGQTMSRRLTLDGLLKVPGELTISHVFRLATPSVAKRFIDGIRKYHEGRRLDARAVLAAALKGGDTAGARQNEARSSAAQEANRRAGKVEMAEELYGFYNLSIIAWSPVYEETPANVQVAAETAYGQAVATHKAVEEVLRGAHFAPVARDPARVLLVRHDDSRHVARMRALGVSGHSGPCPHAAAARRLAWSPR